jgi:hypothetical protein
VVDLYELGLGHTLQFAGTSYFAGSLLALCFKYKEKQVRSLQLEDIARMRRMI